MFKYWHLFLVSLKQRNVFVFDVLSSLFSYSIRIFLVITLYRYLNANADPASFGGYSVRDLSWGLIFAQIATVGMPNLSWEISEDVKSGKIAVYLLNPVRYPIYKALEVLSGAFSNLVVMTVLALCIGAAFAGLPQISIASVAGSLVLLVGSFFIFSLLHLIIGLLAFVLEEVQPIRWIVWKLNLLLGGNILPVSFFPPWLQTVAFASPFAYTGYTAGIVFARFEPESFLRFLAVQTIWIVTLGSVVALTYSYFSRRLMAN